MVLQKVRGWMNTLVLFSVLTDGRRANQIIPLCLGEFYEWSSKTSSAPHVDNSIIDILVSAHPTTPAQLQFVCLFGYFGSATKKIILRWKVPSKLFPCLLKIKFNHGNFSRRRELAKPNLRFHLRRYELTTEENFKILYNLILFGVLITFLRLKTFVFNKKKYTWQFHHLRHLFSFFCFIISAWVVVAVECF